MKHLGDDYNFNVFYHYFQINILTYKFFTIPYKVEDNSCQMSINKFIIILQIFYGNFLDEGSIESLMSSVNNSTLP